MFLEGLGNGTCHRIKNDCKKEYLELDLDDAVLREVETLAREAGATPFEMCVTLLRESLLASASAGATPSAEIDF